MAERVCGCCIGGVRARGVCRLIDTTRRLCQRSRCSGSDAASHGSDVWPRRAAGNAHSGVWLTGMLMRPVESEAEAEAKTKL